VDQNQTEIERLRRQNVEANDLLKELADVIGWHVIGPRPRHLKDAYHRVMAHLDDQGS